MKKKRESQGLRSTEPPPTYPAPWMPPHSRACFCAGRSRLRINSRTRLLPTRTADKDILANKDNSAAGLIYLFLSLYLIWRWSHRWSTQDASLPFIPAQQVSRGFFSAGCARLQAPLPVVTFSGERFWCFPFVTLSDFDWGQTAVRGAYKMPPFSRFS